METVETATGLTAREAGFARCESCGLLAAHSETPDAAKRCRRCGASVHMRKPLSLQRTWAFLLVGMLCYIPANMLPIMNTTALTGSSSDTIISGVFVLLDMGSWFVAAVVFVASICIPVAKFLIIIMIALSLQSRFQMSTRNRHRLQEITEFIGRWSMIDVFVVAVLAALIQLGAIVTITPGDGINAFAASVIFTMLSANSLDSRMIWDRQDNGE